ncbi:hypothetical protein [Pseudorhodoferax sp. Leaf267]|uniref:hypothetical protein n=1 Tax=Pseudorhodoferax sp. Leaf267 TaxID=1736316 RepID=UPI0012E17495|nr:hypothetical protein [Pseudorhodoferax sp. Leaf267]
MLIVSWFTRLFPGWTAASAEPAAHSVATSLLQSATSLAGTDPHEAQQLRNAAQAWLSVVR